MAHKFLIAKLHSLKFDMNALNLNSDHLTGRKQRVKINSTFSTHMDLFHGVPQESVYSIYFSTFASYLLKKLIL